MKKLLIAVFIVGCLAFALISVFRVRPTEEYTSKKDNTYTAGEKDNIRKFWKHYRQATEYRIAANPGQAATEYQLALSFNEKHEDALYYAGNVHRELGEYEKAVDCWKSLLLVNPQSARAHIQLGDIYLDAEANALFDAEAAEAEYLRALEINGEASKALLRIGQIALIKGNLQAAGDQFHALAGNGKTGATASFLKGYVDWKSGLKPNALAFFKKFVAYSMPEKTVDGFSREGDSRNKKPLDPFDRFENNPLLSVRLGDFVNSDDSLLAAQMELKYRELDEYLVKIRTILRH